MCKLKSSWPTSLSARIYNCTVQLTQADVVLVDLEWKIIYVSSAESEDHDQVLDSVLVGPVPPGKHMFVFQV